MPPRKPIRPEHAGRGARTKPRPAANQSVASLSPRRGEVWMVNFSPVVGHEQAGVRPAVVVSADTLNRAPLELLTVLPITSRPRNLNLRVELKPPEGGLRLVSYVITEQVRTISRLRLRQRLGVLRAESLAKCEESVRVYLDL